MNSSLIPIKVQCGCGQKYAFDVEPLAGKMPGPVACPVCGADGTSTANVLLSQHLTVRPAPAAPAATSAVRVAMPATAPARVAPAMAPSVAVRPVAASNGSPGVSVAAAPHAAPPGRPGARLPGQMDEAQARAEARAKIWWGNEPAEVLSFLRVQGIAPNEAKALVDSLVAERTSSIRKKGIKKIFQGLGCMLLPVVGLPLLLGGYLYFWAITVLFAIYGLVQFLKGLLMFIAPKGEPGDVSED